MQGLRRVAPRALAPARTHYVAAAVAVLSSPFFCTGTRGEGRGGAHLPRRAIRRSLLEVADFFTRFRQGFSRPCMGMNVSFGASEIFVF